MKKYYVNSLGDLKFADSNWVVHDKRNSVEYVGFDTRHAAFKYAYTLLKKRYASKSTKNCTGLIRITQIPPYNPKCVEYQCGWFHGNPSCTVDRGGITDFYRIYSDGTTRLVM